MRITMFATKGIAHEFLWRYLLLTTVSIHLVHSATYTLVAPQKAVPGVDYQALLYSFEDVDVNVVVTDFNYAVVHSSTVHANANDATLITVQIGTNYLSGTYQLATAASDGSFSASTSFEVIQKSHSIFIQTDKAIYKPSHTVQFRVLVTSADLKPYNTLVTVVVQDSNGHKIMQWTDQALTLGVASFELPLSDQPPLGIWSIQVTAGSQSQAKSFDVEEYTLPRFQVTVDLPSYVVVSQQQVSGFVCAKYTYGENVQGTAVVVFQINGVGLSKTFAINGNASFVLSAKDLGILGLTSSASSTLTAAATVTETLTGISLSGSSSVAVSQYDAEVAFLSQTSDYYKRGLNYTAYVKVSHPDGSLLSTAGLMLSLSAYYSSWVAVPVVPVPLVTAAAVGGKRLAVASPIWYNYQYQQTTFFTSKANVPDYGIATVAVSVPANVTGSFTIQAQLSYKGQTISATKSVNAFQVQGSNNVRVTILGSADSLQSGDTVSFGVQILQPSSRYFYIAEARGRIVSYATLNENPSTFSVKLTPEHAPQSTFIVYLLGPDNETVADSVTVNVAGLFRNQISVLFQDDQGQTAFQAKPGDNVTLQVSSSPNSLVGVLAVDESVLLLAGGNDITQDQLLSDVNSFTDSSSGGGSPQPFIMDFFWPRWGGSSSSQIFTDAKLSIVTDSIISQYYSIIFEDRVVPMALGAGVAVAPAPVEKSQASTTADTSVPVRTRSYFPETWIWSLLLLNNTGVGSIKQAVPDSITSWVTTAFSMNADSGLAVTPSASKFKVFQNFFVSTVLPYSIVRGEEAALKVVVFNYMDTKLSIVVYLPRSALYTARLGSDTSNSSAYGSLSQAVTVAAGSGSTVQFWITPQVLGTIKIVVSAVSPSGGDQVENDLLVKPEGVEQSYCLSEFVILQKLGSYNHTFNIQYPSKVVSGSRRVEASVSGDVMGPSIQGLDQLVQVPYGCGEQNMITVCPNIFVREYLESIGNINPVLRSNTQANMLLGYQQELTYLRKDGFFSAFGDSDSAGSTWLTAFVIKSFRQAKPYLGNSLDDNVLNTARDKILQQRLFANGSFVELGHVIHVDMQGGSGMGESLTAYVLIALLEDNTEGAGVLTATQRTVPYLENALANIATDPYKMAIVTYSLVLANSSKALASLASLEKLSIVRDGTMHWSKGDAAAATPGCYYCPVPSGASDVEMTSYALLTYVKLGDLVKASQVAKWLTAQRSSLGGFTSTQDTVLGLQSLAKYAQLVRPADMSLTVTFQADNSELVPQITVTGANSLLLQSAVVQHPDTLSSLSFIVAGQGSVIMSTCVSYYALSVPAVPLVDLRVTITPHAKNSSTTNVQACAASTATGASAKGMCIIEVNLASGYSVESGSVTSSSVRRVDYSDAKVALYFDQCNATFICATVPMQQTVAVNSVKAAYVEVYQYYNPDQGKIVSYNPGTGAVGSSVSVSATQSPTAKPTMIATTAKATVKATTTTAKATVKATTTTAKATVKATTAKVTVATTTKTQVKTVVPSTTTRKTTKVAG